MTDARGELERIIQDAAPWSPLWCRYSDVIADAILEAGYRKVTEDAEKVDRVARYLLDERLVHCGICAGSHWDSSCDVCHAIATDHARTALGEDSDD